MKKILVLSTDTYHHQYFVNKLLLEGVHIDGVIYETHSITPPFATGPVFEDKEEAYDRENFFRDVPKEVPPSLISYVDRVNSRNSINLIKQVRPDLGLVFGTGWISDEVIGQFKDGLLNIHRGIAQEYRGLESDLWAIYHRDYSNIGVTVHKVESKLDAGGIVYQDRIKLHKGMKTHQLRYAWSVLGTELVLKAVKDYLKGELKSYPQEKLGRYYSFMPLPLKKIVNARFNKYCEKL